MTIQEFLQAIETTYNKHFPKSKVFVKYEKNIYRSITIKCCLAENQKENNHGYWENDLFRVSFIIEQEGKRQFPKEITEDSMIDITMELSCWHKNYFIKPQSKYLCYSSRELSFRKTKGDCNKILKTLDNFFFKLKEQLKQDIKDDLIHNNHIELVKAKI